MDNVLKSGQALQDGLKTLAGKFDCIGAVRGRGLMVGAEIVSTERSLDGELAKAIKVESFRNRLIVETGGRHGAVLRFLPSLLITESEIGEALARLETAIRSVVSSPRTRSGSIGTRSTLRSSHFLSTQV